MDILLKKSYSSIVVSLGVGPWTSHPTVSACGAACGTSLFGAVGRKIFLFPLQRAPSSDGWTSHPQACLAPSLHNEILLIPWGATILHISVAIVQALCFLLHLSPKIALSGNLAMTSSLSTILQTWPLINYMNHSPGIFSPWHCCLLHQPMYRDWGVLRFFDMLPRHPSGYPAVLPM